MSFAPLGFLRGHQPRRSTTKFANPCNLEDSQNRTFRIEYITPTKDFPYTHRQVFPAPKPGHPYEASRYFPPPHYHLLQDEHFKVESGRGIWYLDGGKTKHRLNTGDEILVPMWKWHWFEMDPECAEPFSVLYRYDKEYMEMEHRFFKNVMTYLADCQASGIEMSLFQLQVFSMHNWMPIGVINKGPEWFKFVSNTLLMFWMGFIGQFLLGYSKSYPEYYQRETSKEA